MKRILPFHIFIPLKATSTSPQIQIGRKRRLSIVEPDEESLPSTPKKLRAESEERSGAIIDNSPKPSSQSPTQEAEVKEVTQGVHDVELSEPMAAEISSDAATIPLPDSPGLDPPRTAIAESSEYPSQAALLTEEVVKQSQTSTQPIDDIPKESTSDPTTIIEEMNEGETSVDALEGKGERPLETPSVTEEAPVEATIPAIPANVDNPGPSQDPSESQDDSAEPDPQPKET
ncbi:hypothetical protein NLI96_g1286 [Meripilus lineatus]|uniref:Uncharacterized protein n=1 Tax=Meripilus lineatus TaxID=2056292 RepID=A0AAD5VCA2_9APHY|nr:hypothetical protein NLI96_g1286 [Physisporinus lineatus]